MRISWAMCAALVSVAATAVADSAGGDGTPMAVDRWHGEEIIVAPPPDADLPPDPTIYVTKTGAPPAFAAWDDNGFAQVTLELLGVDQWQCPVWVAHIRARRGKLHLLVLDGMHEPIVYRIDPRRDHKHRLDVVYPSADRPFEAELIDVRADAPVLRLEWAVEPDLVARGKTIGRMAMRWAAWVPTVPTTRWDTQAAEGQSIEGPLLDSGPTYFLDFVPVQRRAAIRVTALYTDGSSRSADASWQASAQTAAPLPISCKPTSAEKPDAVPREPTIVERAAPAAAASCVAAAIVFAARARRRRRRCTMVVPKG